VGEEFSLLFQGDANFFPTMAYLFKHSTFGSLIHYCRQGNFSFTRRLEKSISSSSSTDDVMNEAPLEGKISANHLVTWDGPSDPSNPKNWPFWQKIVITAILRCVLLA
jgi:DHA1 family multidrug resistance protein-like MFS transporter